MPVRSSNQRKRPDHDAIVRAVASSTAIETGERIDRLEAKLRGDQGKAPQPTLALKRSVKPAQG